MSEEYLLLQNLLKEGKIELRLKKSMKDTFCVWIYWVSETKKPKFVWKSFFILYWLLSSEWFWIPFSIVLALKINKLYFACLLMPFFVTRLLRPIGQGFMIFDARNDEVLFDDLWNNKAIAIMSTEKHESVVHKNGVPDFIIDPHKQDWKERINEVFAEK